MQAAIKNSLKVIGLLGGSAVALGALGAHALKNQLVTGKITADQLAGFDTGVRYQMYHTLAMFLLLLLNQQFPSLNFERARRFFLWGIVLFSGSLYLLCTRGLSGIDFFRYLGPVTPLGGVLMVAGWLFLFVEGFKKS